MIGTSLQHLQIVVYVCALAISTAAIAGRLWARWMTGRKLQSNDYLMVIAYVRDVRMCISSLGLQ